MERTLPSVEEFQVERVISLLRLLWDLDSGLHRASSRMRRELRVNGRERLVLKLLGRYSGLTASGLARFMGATEWGMARLLARLEKRRLVERSSNSHSRALSFWRLTASGEEVDRAWAGTVEQAIRRALHTLPADSVENGTSLLLVIATAIRRVNRETRVSAPPPPG